MKRHLLLLFTIVFIFSACQKTNSKYIYNNGSIYGTVYSIIYESPEGKDFQEDISEKFKEYTLIFSTYEKESIISKINNNEPVK